MSTPMFSVRNRQHHLVTGESLILTMDPGVMGEIASYLNLTDGCHLWATCRELWYRPRRAGLKFTPDDTKRLVRSRQIPIPALDTSRELMRTMLSRLRVVDAGPHATDVLLQTLVYSTFCQKNLEILSMVHSLGVTDQGLLFLRGTSLKYLDLTYCRNTSYEATLVLRKSLPCLQCLRRQPEWMDGVFITPFGGRSYDHSSNEDADDQQEKESHTYWPDGTFCFRRGTQSRGWVRDLWETYDDNEYNGSDDGDNLNKVRLGREIVSDKLQYVDFEVPNGWPDLLRYCYRPGVSIRRILPSGDSSSLPLEDESSTPREVLVAQNMTGLRPPSDAPTALHAQATLPHTSVTFDRHGKVSSTNRKTMISRMVVQPLPSLLPPPELIQENEAFANEMDALSLDELNASEELLHRIFEVRNSEVNEE